MNQVLWDWTWLRYDAPSSFKTKEVVKMLMKLEFVKMRQKDSHLFFQHPDGRTMLVTVHGNEDIGRGLLRLILQEIEMPSDEFLKLR